MSDRVRRLSLASIAILVGWIASVAVGIWIASAYVAHADANTATDHDLIVDHERRLRSLEDCCVEARSDSRWIRAALERIEKKLP